MKIQIHCFSKGENFGLVNHLEVKLFCLLLSEVLVDSISVKFMVLVKRIAKKKKKKKKIKKKKNLKFIQRGSSLVTLNAVTLSIDFCL